MSGRWAYASALNIRTPMARRCATRTSSLHLYRIGHETPTSGPARSKYPHTRRSIRGGRK